MATGAQQKSDGPLPILLLVLTFVTGLIDAVSFFRFDHVFVANMTGNIVFLAFAVADTREFSIAASSIALAGFLAGALVGGRLGNAYGSHRGRYLALALALSALIFGVATIGAAVFPQAEDAWTRYLIVALLAIAMGVQTAAARRLSVPDLTTTVLTLTLTAFAADSRWAGGGSPRPLQRIAAVVTMFAGAALGATMVLQLNTAVVIGLAFLVVVAAAAIALQFRKSTEPWTMAAR